MPDATRPDDAPGPAPMADGRLEEIAGLSLHARCSGYFETADAIDDSLDEVRRLRAEVARLTAALQRIRSECGAVCPEFETCEHPACSSSCGAWLIADAALAGMVLEPPPTKNGGPTP